MMIFSIITPITNISYANALAMTNPTTSSSISGPVEASTSVPGVKVFGNGTIITSVNGKSMSFFFDPNGPAKRSHVPSTLTHSTSFSAHYSAGDTATTLSSPTGLTAFSDIVLATSTAYSYLVSEINSLATNLSPNTAFAATGTIALNGVQTTSGTLSKSPFQITLSNFNAGTSSDGVLIVGIMANNNLATSVTFGGIPLVRVVSSFSNNDAEFWYLKNPTGTANIIVTMGGSTSVVVGAYSFSGVDQTNPIPTTATNHNIKTTSSPTISITTTNPNSWVIDLPSIYGGVTLGSPTCTQQWDINMPNAITGASSSTIKASAGLATCSWTASGSGDLWDDVAIEVKASGTSTATAPGSPTGLAATAVSSSQINLSWAAPSSDGGSPITGYMVERSTNGGITWSTIVSSTGSTATTYSDTGLAASTTYTYRVSAINSVGTSSPSNTASANTGTTTTSSISQVQSGLVASDPLNNETETRQQVLADTKYWSYDGSAVPLHAPYDIYKDSLGLHIGVQAKSNGKWAGFFAVTPNTNAPLFHSVISNPVRTIPTQYYENGLYVQTSQPLINYVTCSSLTNADATIWTVVNTYGDANQASKYTVLWIDNSPDQSLTKDCTIITNGNNYLKVYLDGVMVYSSNKLNLKMPAPFNAYLEPETSYAGKLLYGIYTDYYATSDENIQVKNNPSNAARADVVDSSGKVLATSQVSGGIAKLDVGKYHFPIMANIKVYDSTNTQIASTSSAVSITGGDVFAVN